MSAIARGLRYPLRLEPLFLIIVCALLYTLALYAGPLGLPLAIILSSWFLKYGFAVFDSITLGFPTPPVLSYEMVNPFNEQRPLGQFFIVWAYYAATGLLAPWISDGGVTLLRALGLVALPASVATLGVTGNVLQAVNPRLIFGLMYRMGAYYVAILAFAVFFPAIVAYMVSRGLEFLLLAPPLYFAVVLYAWLALFSILGTLLYERRRETTLETWFSPEQTQAKLDAALERQRDRTVDEFYLHWRTGSYANAWKAVERHIGNAANPVDDYVWIHERATKWPDQRLAIRVALELLPLLLRARRNSDALDVVRARLRADPAFRLRDAADLVHLAQVASDVGDRAIARTLLNDFERHYPDQRAKPIVEQLRAQLTQ